MKLHSALVLLYCVCCGLTAPLRAQDTATYEMTFRGLWTADDITDSSLPGSAHFTQVIGATHNAETSLWEAGALASPGVELVAELGNTSALRREISDNANAGPAIAAGSSFIGPGATVSTVFTVDASLPLVSVLSMVAPTPDWFVGVSNLRLYDGGWRDRVTVDLYPYDAGTEDGGGWSLGNPDTSPQGLIASLRGVGRFRNNPLARLVFERQIPPGVSLSASALSVPRQGATASYTLALDSRPDAEVLITPTTSDAATATVSGPVRFSPTNWDSPQTIVVTGIGAGSATVNHAISTGDGGGYAPGLGIPAIAVTVTAAATMDPDTGGAGMAADHSRLFPLLVDGGGFRSHLFLDNVPAQANPCLLEFTGAGLDIARLEQQTALTAAESGASISTGGADAAVMLATTGEQALAIGYAELTCDEPAVARMLLVRESGGAPAAMMSLESTRPGDDFRFPVLPRHGRLGLILANDNAVAAVCAAKLTTAGGGDIAIPAQSTVFRFLDEMMALPRDAADSAVILRCDQAIAAVGMLLGDGVFTALEAVVPEDRDETRSYRLMPLLLDGGGFQSRLVVMNLSDEANRCRLHLRGEVSTARFENAGGVTHEGTHRAVLELAGGSGGQLSMSSSGRRSLAFGHAALDCGAPVALRNLLSLRSPEGLAGMAAVAPAAFARVVRFPVAPWFRRMALVLSNDAGSSVSCEAALILAGRNETIRGGTPVLLAGESTTLRFLSDLFALPDDFAGGAAKLECDGEVAAISLPLAGTAFTAMPPFVAESGAQTD